MKIIEGCLFCRIANGMITDNVFRLYEDERIMAVLSNSPVSTGHSIIMTKEHLCNPSSLSEEIAGRLFYVAARIGVAAKRSLDADGYDIFAADGYCAGQNIEHFHIHLVPRFQCDGISLNLKTLEITDRSAEISSKIISHLKILPKN